MKDFSFKKTLASFLVVLVLSVSLLSSCSLIGSPTREQENKQPSTSEETTPPKKTEVETPKKVNGRYAFLSEVTWQEGDLVIHFLDVGHGDSIFIQFPDATTMLIDAGSSNLLYNPATYIRDYIQTVSASNNIDYLILTHPHIDHCKALEKLISWFNFSYFYTPDITPKQMDTKSYTKYHEAMVKVTDAEIIYNVGIHEVKDIFTLYGASPEMYENIGFSTSSKSQLNDEINSISPIAVLEYANRRIVLTGDATITTEEYFMSLLAPAELLKTDVLKVGHHGREGSSGNDFLEFLQPRFAVISVGGLIKPDDNVLTRLSNAVDEDIFRTDVYGAVAIKISPNSFIEIFSEKSKST